MQNWRNLRDDERLQREVEDRTERARRERERGMHFQDEYDLDRTRRAPGYGGLPTDARPEREWAPGGTRALQQSYPQDAYRPSWSWNPPAPSRREPPEPASFGGQYEGTTPPEPDPGYRPYIPLLPPPPHRQPEGAFQRFKELIGKGPKGYRRSDERILEDVHERLSHGYLDASDIEVRVKDGEVTLEGTVRSKHDRRLVEDLVEDTLGVRELDNRLKVKKPDASPPRL